MKVTARNSYTICYQEQEKEKFGLIQFFLCSSSTAVAIITPLNTAECPTSMVLTSKWITTVTFGEQLKCITVSQILCKCILIVFSTSMYCCKISDKFNCD